MTAAPPSTRSSGTANPDSFRIRSRTSRDLERDGLDGRPCEVRARRAAGEPDDRPAGMGVPPRRAESCEGRNEHDAAAVGNRGGQRPGLGRVPMIPSPSRSHWIAEPETKTEPSSA